MHAVFMAYGMEDKVRYFLDELVHTKLPLTYTKGKKKMFIPIQCQVRILPFGVYEFIFPREHQDVVLTTLRFHQKPPYNLNKKILGLSPLKMLKKFLRIMDAPKDFDTKKILPIFTDFVSIIPLGVRHDPDLVEKSHHRFPGWKHEAV